LKLAVFGVQVDMVLIEEFNRGARGERRRKLKIKIQK